MEPGFVRVIPHAVAAIKSQHVSRARLKRHDPLAFKHELAPFWIIESDIDRGKLALIDIIGVRPDVTARFKHHESNTMILSIAKQILEEAGRGWTQISDVRPSIRCRLESMPVCFGVLDMDAGNSMDAEALPSRVKLALAMLDVAVLQLFCFLQHFGMRHRKRKPERKERNIGVIDDPFVTGDLQARYRTRNQIFIGSVKIDNLGRNGGVIHGVIYLSNTLDVMVFSGRLKT